MAEITRIGNYVVIDYDSRLLNLPVVATTFTYDSLSLAYDIRSIATQEVCRVLVADIPSISDGVGFYTEATFLAFLRRNTGLTDTVYSPNPTGWASYSDNAYTSGSPFTVLAGVPTLLPNNAGIIVDSQKPIDIDTFYTGAEITGRNGDSLDIMIYFKTVPSSINASLDVWIDIGGAIGELYRQTFYFRGAIEHGVMYSLSSAYTLDTWEANGGVVWVEASVDMDVYGMTYNFDRTHKAIII